MDRNWYIAALDLRGGSSPWLDVGRVPTSLSVSREAAHVLNITSRTGSLRSTLQLRSLSMRSKDPDQAAGIEASTVAPLNVYGEAFRHIRHTATITRFDHDRAELSAEHRLWVDTDGPRPLNGLESSFWPALSMIDHLVMHGQLLQAVICTAHEIDREQMGNMWMRQVRIHIVGPPTPVPAALSTRTRIIDDRVLDRAGQRIHDITIESDSSIGVGGVAKVAYIEG